jgi:hypothetical protein
MKSCHLQETGDHHVLWNKPHWERQISHVLSHMWNLYLKKIWITWILNKGTAWEWEPVEVGRVKGEWKWFKYCIHMFENWSLLKNF